LIMINLQMRILKKEDFLLPQLIAMKVIFNILIKF
jgi:hypothetical protein